MRKISCMFAAVLAIAARGVSAQAAESPDLDSGTIFNAMEQELVRSMSRLKFEDFKSPYFMDYKMEDANENLYVLSYGALVKDQAIHNRMLCVEARYGSFDNDNSDENYQGVFDWASLEDNPDALRHKFWLVTDQAYKSACREYLQKQGKKISEVEKDKVPDFSVEKPSRDFLVPVNSQEGMASYIDTMKKTTEEFKKTREILDSQITFKKTLDTLYHINSEGTKLLTPGWGNEFFVYLWARTQSEDGMSLDVSRTYSSQTLEKLPDANQLKEIAGEMTQTLLSLKQAKLADPYTGPAILDPESTGVLFHEAVGHRLEGERQRDEHEGQTFKGEVGKQIIPPFLTVEDDPTLRTFQGTDLNGAYAYDNDGIPAQRVALIRDGVLKDYLLSRRPILGFLHSNGHGRAAFGRHPIGRMSNLLVKSSREVPEKELEKMLIEECKAQNKPYGLIIKRTRSGDTFTGRGAYQAFKGAPEEVYLVDAKTGAKTLVRGVEVVGTPLITISKIIATGKDYRVMNAFCVAESGTIPVSTIAPSSLVKEVELQRQSEEKLRPPILPPPLFDANP